MRALVFHGPHDLTVEDRPDPKPAAGEVVLDVLATGICGSDLHGYTGENGRRHPGQVMGHETVARVGALGPGVTGPAIGALVTVNPVIGCGRCEACLDGRTQQCPDRRVIGVDRTYSSAFAERMAVPAGNVIELPADLPAELGSLVEPLAVGWHAARRGAVRAEDAVLVIGGGPIGQAAALAAERAGSTRVLVSEPDAARRALVEHLGFATVDPRAEDLAAGAVTHLGRPADVVLDAVGSDGSLAGAVTASRRGAVVVLVGMGAPRVTVDAYAISTAERTLVGSFCYDVEEFRGTATWTGEQAARLAPLVEGRVDLDGAPAAFRDLAAGSLRASKVLVFPHGIVP